MTRLKASFFLLLLWAAIYLPGLGATELKGEEGRRILPAVTMLETGQWLVPYVGGKPFLRKPPLVNWMIAASFKLTGVRNEWTARLPAALCVLALGLTIVGTSGAGWLKVETAFVAAVLAMTQIGLLAKARFAGAEIEGIYVPLAEMALVLWLSAWARGLSRWRLWVPSGVLLGLASLAKGPSLHLLFFYGIVLMVVAVTARRAVRPVGTFVRTLLHPAHLVSLAVSAGIFAAWAVPYFKMPEAREAAAVWKRQGIDRFTEAEVSTGGYLLNVPRGLTDQLPWLVLLPLLVSRLRRGEPLGGGEVAASPTAQPVPWRAVTIAAGGLWLALLLVPGALPRYVLPLGGVLALAFAMLVAEEERAWRPWSLILRGVAVVVLIGALVAPVVAGMPFVAGGRFDLASAGRAAIASTCALAVCAFIFARRPQALTAPWLAGASAALAGAGMLLYAGAAVRWITRGDDLRPLAAAVDAAVPAGASVTLYDPGYQAWIFYLRSRYDYATALEDVPMTAPVVVTRGSEKVRRKLAENRPDLALAQTLRSRGGTEFFVYRPR